MTRTGLRLLPRVIGLALAAGSLTGPGVASPQVLSARSAGIVTAILIGAASTQAAVDRSDGAIRRLFDQERALERAKLAALRQAGLAEQARSRLATELAATRRDQENMLLRIAAHDHEYAVTLAAYREGLTGLLTERDPRLVAGLQRYADGDTAALDDLQDIAHLIRQAREAGLRARDGADQRGIARIWTDAKDKGERTTAQALAAWREAATIDPDDFWQWISIARLEREEGLLPAASAAVTEAGHHARGSRDRAVVCDESAVVAMAQGQLEAARQAQREGLALRRALAAEHPDSSAAKRELSVSLDKVGDVDLAQRRPADARVAYLEALGLRRWLADAMPGNRGAKRDLYVSLDKVGDAALAAGDFDTARHAYDEGLGLCRRLVTQTTGAIARRDLSVALDKIGTVALAQKRLDDARQAFDEALGLRRDLAIANPSSAAARWDLALTLGKVGKVALARGRLDVARSAFEEAVSVRRRIADIDPSNAVARRDVALSLDDIGEVAVAQGDLTTAKQVCTQALALRRQLAANEPSDTAARRDVIVSLIRLGTLTADSDYRREALSLVDAMAASPVPADQRMASVLRAKIKASGALW